MMGITSYLTYILIPLKVVGSGCKNIQYTMIIYSKASVLKLSKSLKYVLRRPTMPVNLGIPMICFSDQTHQYYYHCPSVSEYICTEHREPKLNPDRLVVLPMKSVVQVS